MDIMISIDPYASWLWEDKTFTKCQAWLYLHCKASGKPNKVIFRDRYHPIEKGQFICSENILANSWGWSRNKVRSFLHLLVEESLITVTADKRKTIISICEPEDNGNVATIKSTRQQEEKASEEVQGKVQLNSHYINGIGDVKVQVKGTEMTKNETSADKYFGNLKIPFNDG